MTQALVAALYGRVNGNLRRQCMLVARVAIGASGAPTVTFGPEGFSITLGAAGTYTGTMPTGERGVGFVQVLDEVGATCNFTALDASAGTFAIETHTDPGVDTAGENLASGSELHFMFVLEGG